MVSSTDSTSIIDELQKEITDLTRQNEQLRRQASFHQLNPSPVLEFDHNGKVIYLNPAAEQVISQLRQADAGIFLPDDFPMICQEAREKGIFQIKREKKVGDHIFEENISYSTRHDVICMYIADITGHRTADAALIKNKQELLQMQDFIEAMTKGANVLLATVDMDYHYTYFNQLYQEKVKRLSGKDIEIGMKMISINSDSSDQQKVLEQEWRRVFGGESTNEIIKFRETDNVQRFYNVLHTPIRNIEGNIVGAGEVAIDITDQIGTQEALAESEARFRMVLKNAPISVAAQDKDLHFTWAYNQRTVNPVDIIGKTDEDIFIPEVAAWTTGLKRQVLETGKELHDQRWIISGGQRLFLDIFLEPIHNQNDEIIGVGVATVDLTAVKEAEQALRESEERYRTLFESMTEGFAIHEIIYDDDHQPCDYRFLDINPAFERLTGLNRDQVIGKTYHQVLPEEGDTWVKKYGQVVFTGEPAQFEDFSPSLNKYYEIFAYRSAPDQFAVIFMDITQRKKFEDDMRINLTKYSVLFNSFPLGVTVSDKNGNIIESNQEAVLLLGLPEEEQNRRKIDDKEWKIIRPDKTPMPKEEFASVRALNEQRRVENIEMGIVKNGDQVTWLSVTAAPLPLENYGVVITYKDITTRILSEETLRLAHEKLEQTVQERTEELSSQTKALEAQRKRFNDVLEILPAYLILLTPDYHVEFANRYFRERFGEDHGRHCFEYLFGRSEACENCETYKTLKAGKDLHWEWTGPDNHNYDVYDFPFADMDGSTLILEMGIDITDRKKAEDQLRRLNAYNRRLIEANLDALVTITLDGKIGDVNTVTEAITGFLREDLIGTDFSSYFTDPEKARKGYEQVFETGDVRDYELEIQHKDGHITPVIYNASIYRDEGGKVAGVFAAARDITERKQAEKELVLLNTALEAAANGIIVTECDGTIIWTNSAFSQMTGYCVEEIVGKNPRFLKSGQQDKEFYRNLWQAILSGMVWRGELVNRRKDGSLYHEEQTITPVFDKNGSIINFISIRQDITEHKQAEEALRKSEEQYRSLAIATTQIVWKTNVKGEVVEDIPMWRAYTGQAEEELMGTGWINAVHPDDQQRTADIWAFAVNSMTPYDTEYRIRNRSGDYGYFTVRGVPIKDNRGNISGWIGTCTDITEKRNYENQLHQAEKHAAIGRMVGSVTHEINNPLQTIKNCLYLIQQETGPSSPNTEPLEMALSETQRLSNIVGQLRQLYRPQAAQMKRSQDLLELMEEVHALIEPHLCNSNVSWRLVPGVENCEIDCIKDQMIEVLLNICLNGIEAMQPNGGTLSLDLRYSTDHTQVGVVISDTGLGIKPEILAHLFEPFITTKEYGLGLGLSICYGIVQKHGGQITVDSQPGQGTSFTVWLPISA